MKNQENENKWQSNYKEWHSFKFSIPSAPKLIDGVEVEQEAKEYLFKLKKPSASQRQSADLIRSLYTTSFIEKGLMPEAILRKKLEDAGGTASKSEVDNYLTLTLKLKQLESEYQLLKTEGKLDESNAKFLEWNEVQRQLINIESEQSRAYENSAEAKARNKMIQFFVYELLYWMPTADAKDYVQYFSGESFEDKQRDAFAKEDEENEVYQRVVILSELFVTALLYSKGKIAAEALDKLPSEMGLTE